MTSLSSPRKTIMPYVRLGNSGLKVSKIILGTLSFGNPKWSPWMLDEEEAIKHIKVAYDAGIQTFDTSNNYSNGESERILGKAIKILNMPRDEIVVMTKVLCVVANTPEGQFFLTEGAEENGYVNQGGLSRKNIFGSVKQSLKRLQLDYIDVLQCHRFDYNTPIEETMQALHDVVQAGYVRHIGMCACYAHQFHVMQNYAINNKLTPFISMQNQYNLLYREEEREMIPTLKHFGVGSIPYSPLARGLLTRPHEGQIQTKRSEGDWLIKNAYNAPCTKDIIRRVEEISKKKGITMAQVALAWCISKSSVSAPIVGSTNIKNLEELIAGVHFRLTDDEVKYLEEPYQPQTIFGHS